MNNTVVMCGSRRWPPRKSRIIEVWIKKVPEDWIIICGGATGADRIIEGFARVYERKMKIYKPKWTLYGNAAGPIRNKLMIEKENPVCVIAFLDVCSESRGTRHTIKCALSKKIKTYIVRSDGRILTNVV